MCVMIGASVYCFLKTLIKTRNRFARHYLGVKDYFCEVKDYFSRGERLLFMR